MYEIFEKLLMERGVTAYKVAKATGISTGSMTDWKKAEVRQK
jgi:repressor LexA